MLAIEMVTSVLLVGETSSIEWSGGKYSDSSWELKQKRWYNCFTIKIQSKTSSDKESQIRIE